MNGLVLYALCPPFIRPGPTTAKKPPPRRPLDFLIGPLFCRSVPEACAGSNASQGTSNGSESKTQRESIVDGLIQKTCKPASHKKNKDSSKKKGFEISSRKITTPSSATPSGCNVLAECAAFSGRGASGPVAGGTC